MSDDEADPELLELLRQQLGIKPRTSNEVGSDTKVLRDAEYIYSNAIDVAIDRSGTISAAEQVWTEMRRRLYSRSAWSGHELHPKARDEGTLNFVFALDLLNFSFWSELPEDRRWSVEYRGKRWTGYWSLVACLQRALDEGIPITTPQFWLPRVTRHEVEADQDPATSKDMTDSHGKGPDGGDCEAEAGGTKSEEVLDRGEVASERKDEDGETTTAQSIQPAREDPAREDPAREDPAREDPVRGDPMSQTETHLTAEIAKHVFRGDGDEIMPLLSNRMAILLEAGQVLNEKFDGSVVKLVESAQGSAGKLANLLAHHFECFRDEAKFDGKKVRFLKRAQIFVADLWSAFDGRGYGRFDDIDCLTMFADYRVPQQLHSLGCFSYSPKLDHVIRKQEIIPSGSSWECQLRGCSIWVVELIRRQIKHLHPDAEVNAVLIDYFLYDLAKEREREGVDAIPHHRTRSIWY